MHDSNKRGIRNTAQDMKDPVERLLALATMMDTGNPGAFIEQQERDGQTQLINSDRLPTKTDGRDDEYRALGFVFGEPDPHDPLFRPATLPPGWTRHGTDHAMWSEIRDKLGRKRVAVFYKAAFYDRQAFMRLETPHSYLLDRLYYGLTPILDDAWLTLDEARRVLADMAEQEEQSANDADEQFWQTGNTFWVERARERRADAAKARRLAESLGVGS